MATSTGTRIRQLVSTAVLVGLSAVFLYQAGLFGMVVWFKYRNPGPTPIMHDTLELLRAREPNASIAYQWVPYEQISVQLKRAVIASEDSGFVEHTGVEWDAIRKALDYNRTQAQKGLARMRGGSTITQQVAKNLFLSNQRSYLRKAQELVLSYMIEAVMDKRRILELYLNIAQWGQSTFGAQAAARHYFKVDAARLSVNQAAQLAAMLPSPTYYDNNGVTSWLRARIGTIRSDMRLVQVPK